MLVICNGAHKSGSSWLFHIITELGDFRFPEPEYLNPAWGQVPSIIPERLQHFVRTHDLTVCDYVCKQHLLAPKFRDLIAAHEHIFLLDIERDIRDVIVSACYHEIRRGQFVGSFDQFYWMQAPSIVKSVFDYHDFWRQPAGKVLLLSYERLHEDFTSEVSRLADFLGIAVSRQKIERVQQRTTLHQLRARSGEDKVEENLRHYRKGVIGDWRSQFSERMLADLEGLVTNGVPAWRLLCCSARRKLHKTFRAYPKTRLRPLTKSGYTGRGASQLTGQ